MEKAGSYPGMIYLMQVGVAYTLDVVMEIDVPVRHRQSIYAPNYELRV